MDDRISLGEAVRRLMVIIPSPYGARRELIEALSRQRLDAFSDDIRNVCLLHDHEMIYGIVDPSSRPIGVSSRATRVAGTVCVSPGVPRSPI